MKSRNVLKWGLGLVFGLLPLAGGCQQDSPSPPPASNTAATTSGADPVPIADADNESAQPSADALAEAPATPLMTEKPVPPTIRPSSPVSEIVKLANSGVDESVMLAFVSNSSSTFNLQADEIIYLNDIGVPGNVVSAMLQHDQSWQALHPNPAPAPPVAPAQPPPATQVPPDAANASYSMETPPSAVEEPDNSNFYDSLAPYGNWVNLDGYGPCWQPTVVVANSGWQPYFDCGHWVYSDCGWYWLSDYSWGWAPFHYGRWFHHNRLGWCWAPGHVWAPSWVCWRHSDSYCGWAPLPPGVSFSFTFGLGFHGHPVHDGDDCGLGPNHFCFVPWGSFHEHHLHGYAVARNQVDQIYHQTTVVNRFVASHNTVINQGIAPSRVAAATHQVMRPVALRDAPAATAANGRVERFNNTAHTLSVYRPQVQPAFHGVMPGARSEVRPGTSSTPTATIMPTMVPTRNVAGATSRQTAAPFILHGQNQVSAARTAPSAPPASSLVVIGRQPGTRPAGATQPATAWNSAPAANTGRNGVAMNDPRWAKPPEPGQVNGANSRATPWLENQQSQPAPAGSAGTPRQYSPSPAYAPPERPVPAEVPRYNSAPAYGTQRSYSAPAPSYRSQPSPAYSAPARSAPAPAYSGGSAPAARSAPSAPSAPSSSSSGGHK